MGVFEGGANGTGQQHGVGRVAVQADAGGGHVDERPVNRDDLMVNGQAQGLGGDGPHVVQHGAGLGARDQAAVGVVGPVGEGFGDETQPGGLGQAAHDGIGQSQQRQVRIHGEDGVDDGLRLRGMPGDGVVQRAVRLHVAHPRAGGRGQRLHGTDLVDHIVGQFSGLHVNETPAETGQVAVPGVRAHAHPAGGRGRAGAADGAGVAGVEPAGHVHAGHRRDDGPVVSEGVAAERFADVAVQINAHAGAPSRE